MDEPVVFLATIRPIQSALSVSGDNNGARLTLDIPENELPAIARLLLMRGKVLRVTVEAQTEEQERAAEVRTWRDRKLKN
jgi:hypothetical protein